MISTMAPEVREKHEFVAQAIVCQPPAFFASRGVAFGADQDDLNDFQVAELALGTLPFSLLRYEGTPENETEIYLPDSVAVDQIPDVIGRIIAEFDLPPSAVTWQRTRLDTPF